MPDYRLYHFERGHIVKVRTLTAGDDAEAVGKARDLAGEETSELWCGGRKVKVYNAAL